MFDKNKKLQEAINNLYVDLKDKDYGQVFTWEEIAKKSGLNNPDKNLVYYVANKVCLMLMVHDSRYLATEHGKGKKIIKPEEHTLYSKKKAQRSVKIYRQAGAIMHATNMDLLSAEQKKEAIDNANKWSTLQMFAEEMLKKKQIGKSSIPDVRTAGLFLDAIKLFSKKD